MTEPRSMTGRTLGGYDILELIARERGVERYVARQRSLEREVELAVLPAAAACVPAERARFREVVRSVARLRHASVLGGIDAGADAGCRYLVMERPEGRSLAAALAAGERLPRRAALDIACGVADAVAHLDSLGLSHGDIGPHTVILTQGLPARLAGFLALHSGASRHLRDGREGRAGLGGDIRAVGRLLFRLLTGCDVPTTGAAPDPRRITPGLPPVVVLLLDRLLRGPDEACYRTAADVVADVRAARAALALPVPETGGRLWPESPHLDFGTRLRLAVAAARTAFVAAHEALRPWFLPIRSQRGDAEG